MRNMSAFLRLAWRVFELTFSLTTKLWEQKSPDGLDRGFLQ